MRWSVGGAQPAPSTVSRGVLLDVARARGVDRLDGGHAVTPEDLEAAEELAGTPSPPKTSRRRRSWRAHG